ncbi:hypothetical protein [Pedobacter montanisoli]|uniref:Prolyl-tRNA synthetase n=1 Tax=Pedobacter montanisoli TaxID=2923277 RepID=A0ABS9ZXN7_9SPHI|nr:hypothetical protein [Pedobacter montanisoli]MCJ0743059.1 hypothetical protein [Pedobacter montanisoli]
MKPKQLLVTVLAFTALFAVSCSTSKLAQQAALQDDVYNSTAQAKEYKPAPPVQYDEYRRLNDSTYVSSDPNYDMDYYSRIDRFYYGNRLRPYYDDYYNYYGYNSWYDPYYRGYYYNGMYDPWYSSYYSWYSPYYNWRYYGSPYYWSTWGPYSYYNPWYGGYGWGGGYWGNGYWGGGYWGGNVIVRNNENYRPRPVRGGDNGVGYRPNGTVIDRTGGTAGRTGGIVDNGNYGRTGGRPEAYNPTTNGTSTNRTTQSRPSRGPETRPSYTPDRPTYTPPPSSSSSERTGGSTSSGSSSGSSTGGGGGRPSRGGGR